MVPGGGQADIISSNMSRVSSRIVSGILRQCRSFKSIMDNPHDGTSVTVAPMEPTEGDPNLHVVVRISTKAAELLVTLSFDVHGFKAPVVRCMTPNRMFEVGSSICIRGMTHFHDEDWDPTTKLSTLVDNISRPLLSDDDSERLSLVGAIGVIQGDPPAAVHATQEYNRVHNRSCLAAFVGRS